jgi:metal iron transporter
MNCPVRTDPAPDEGHNQNPSDLANEITTNNTLNHRRNSTNSRNSRIHLDDGGIGEEELVVEEDGARVLESKEKAMQVDVQPERKKSWFGDRRQQWNNHDSWFGGKAHKTKKVLIKYSKFMGPGFMVSVAYIDPGKHL